MSILYIRDADGKFAPIKAIKGKDGKDAPADVIRYGVQTLDDTQKAQARANIGAAEVEGEYELIETINVEEEAVIKRTVEPDGTPYRFSSIYVKAIFPAAPKSSYSQPTILNAAGNVVENMKAYWSSKSANTVKQYAYVEWRVENGYWKLYWSDLTTNSTVYNLAIGGYDRCNTVSTKHVPVSYGINLGVCPAGTLIEILGVRANA